MSPRSHTKRILASAATAVSLLIVASPVAASEDVEGVGLAEPTYLVEESVSFVDDEIFDLQDVLARRTPILTALSALTQSIDDASNAVLSNLR